MSNRKPAVFIGSSREGLQVAEVLYGHLCDEVDVFFWKEGLFRPGEYALESIEEQIHKSDFAILVGTADDRVEKRNKVVTSIRDNISFELGLFMGALGRRRAFLVIPAEGADVPSDLYGLTVVRYDNERVMRGYPDIHHAIQAAKGRLSSAIWTEWGRKRQAEEQEQRRLQQTRHAQALLRLMEAITRLRDVLVALPGDLINSFDDKEKFEAAKRNAAQRATTIFSVFEQDARDLEVERELSGLVAATYNSILAMPYPDEVLMQMDQYRDAFANVVRRAISAAIASQNLSVVQEEVNQEVQRRLNAVGERYKAWWADARQDVESGTTHLHSALLRASISVQRQISVGPSKL